MTDLIEPLPGDNFVKVEVPPKATGNRQILAEHLWCEEILKDEYRVDSLPFSAFDISHNDIISLHKKSDRLIFESVIHKSGHKNIWILFKEKTESRAKELVETILNSKFGCSFELAAVPFYQYAIDVYPGAPYEEIIQEIAAFPDLKYEISSTDHFTS